MRINVAQQLKGPVGEVRHYRVQEITREGFPLQGELELIRTDRGILVTGKLEAWVKANCSRCLEEFELSLHLTLEEEYFPAKDLLAIFDSLSPEEREGFVIGEDNVLDLEEAIRQHILLNFPIKPICRPDCAGLCPQCGQNLNQGSCGCSREFTDARLSPLKSLLREGS